MMELTDLPNIGPVLAEHLRCAGIETAEQLREAGAQGAFCGSAAGRSRMPAFTSWRRWLVLWRVCGKKNCRMRKKRN